MITKVKKSLQRRVVREALSAVCDFQPIGNISEIIADLKKLQRDLKRKHREFEWFELEYVYDYDSNDVKVVGCRWETDDEYKRRQERSKKAAIARREKLIRDKPYVCPHCEARYTSPAYIKDNECPACME